MKKSALLAALILLAVWSCTSNKSLSDKEKENIRKEVKEAVNTIIKGIEDANADAVLSSWHNSPEFFAVSNGIAYTYNEVSDLLKKGFAEVSNMKYTQVDETFNILDHNTVIYTTRCKFLENYKDGHSAFDDPMVMQYTFRKTDKKWLAVNAVETYSQVGISNLSASEKYPVPVFTGDQKHRRTLSQTWSLCAAGINFAKKHGVTPYEYGKYFGKLYAPTWGTGNNFDKLVKGTIYNTENFRHISDPGLAIKENSDGSVSLLTSEKMWHRYFPEESPFASYAQFLEFSKGIYEPIADYMGASVKLETKDSLLIFTYKKK
jgi:hypothetical protein